MTYRVLGPQHADSIQHAGETVQYTGPHGGGTSYQEGYRTSFQRSGGAFTTKGLSEGRSIAGLGAQNRSGVVNWEGASTPPGFVKN